MIFFWGITTQTKRLGLVAEYCVHCQEVRAMRLRCVRACMHLYYVPVKRFGTRGHDLRCSKCGKVQGADPGRYPAVAQSWDRHANDRVDRLAEHTNPVLSDVMGMSLSGQEFFEASLVEDPAPASQLVRWIIRQRLALTRRGHHIDGPSLMWVSPCALSLALGVTLLIAGAKDLGLVALLGFAATLIGAIAVVSREPARFTRREIEPELAHFARSIDASTHDWDLAISRLSVLDIDLKGWLPRNRLLEIRNRADELGEAGSAWAA